MDRLVPTDLRRQVVRRVRYATNTLALLDNRLPPEGPFDAALTNGLVAIVAEEAPGREWRSSRRDHLRSARELLKIIDSLGTLSFIDTEVLRDGLDLSQPFRHGGADDEFAVIGQVHLNALVALDDHRALHFIATARGHTLDECTVIAFRERAERELPSAPRERLEQPDPETCPRCGRETFLMWGWDDFGGTAAAGECIACGYERMDEEAYELAVDRAIARHLVEDP